MCSYPSKRQKRNSPDKHKLGRGKTTYLFPGDVNPTPAPERDVVSSNKWDGAEQARKETPPPKAEHVLPKNKKHQDWQLMDDWGLSTFFYNFTGLSSVGAWWELIKWFHSSWQQITYALILGCGDFCNANIWCSTPCPGATRTKHLDASVFAFEHAQQGGPSLWPKSFPDTRLVSLGALLVTYLLQLV